MNGTKRERWKKDCSYRKRKVELRQFSFWICLFFSHRSIFPFVFLWLTCSQLKAAKEKKRTEFMSKTRHYLENLLEHGHDFLIADATLDFQHFFFSFLRSFVVVSNEKEKRKPSLFVLYLYVQWKKLNPVAIPLSLFFHRTVSVNLQLYVIKANRLGNKSTTTQCW